MMNRSHGCNICLRAVCIALLLALILLGQSLQPVQAAETKATYNYDVTGEGLVKVTIHPGDATKLIISPTAENLKQTDLTFTSTTNWTKFRRDLDITQAGPNAELS